MSSPVPLSYLDPALSFPNNTSPSRTSSHSSSASTAELSSSPSLYVTFKVLQLVNQFRKRVQTRVRSSRGRTTKEGSSRLTDDFCQEFEREAAEHIDYVLGKTRVNPRKTCFPDRAQRSLLQKRKVSKRSIKVATAAKPETESTAAKKVKWLLKALDKSVKFETHSLSAVAKSHDLFVERRDEFSVKHDSWKELLPQLVRVTNLLDTLRQTPSSRSGVKTFAESDEGADLTFDDNIVANLEHLLLCLKERLIRLLIAELRELVQTHVIECQRNQKQHTKELVLEFPDGRHPLSTTWPWSIRPSLAVIWGVCWMFYAYYFDTQGNMRDQNGDLLFTPQDLEQAQAQIQGQQNYPPATQSPQYQQQQAQNNNQQQYYQGNYPGQDFPPQGSPSEQSSVPRTMLATRHSPVGMMAQPHSQMYGGQTVPASHPFASESSVGMSGTIGANVAEAAGDQAAHAAGGPTRFHTNNAFSAAPPASYATAPPAAVNFSLPEDYQLHYHSSPNNTYGADHSGPWMSPNTAPAQQQQPANYFLHTSLPPQSGIPAPPNLRVDTSNFSGFEQQPQDYLSATPVSATSSNPGATYGQYLSPQNARARAPVMNPSDQPDQPYTTPKSESPVPQAMTAYQHSRKRSHDAMTEGGQGHPHSRNGSRAGSEGYQHQPSGEEDSPRQRLNTTVQRPDPPTNKEGKFICTNSPECEGYVFDRKCEWNKHMDKHDRPYRCAHPDCAKLQGFTYSGGLLRHEREVHNKHGGPKSQLMCHYPDCKRKHKGFTRKENLNEHIRRVHSKESQSQPSMKRDGTDASAMAGALQEDAETPASRYSESAIEHDDSLISPTHQQPKRRRLNSNLGDATEMETLRQDNDNLRAQVEALSRQVQHLEQMMQPQHLPQGGQQGAPGQG